MKSFSHLIPSGGAGGLVFYLFLSVRLDTATSDQFHAVFEDVMDLRNMAIFRMTDRRASWLAQQSKVVAENIANADTPHYRAQEMRPVDFKRMALDASAGSQPLARTNPRHVLGSGNEPYREDVARRTWETSINQNPVVLEEQIEQAARGRSAYDLVMSLYRKNLQFLKSALGVGGGT